MRYPAAQVNLLDRFCAGAPPRFALVSAHQDDEVIGAGSRLLAQRDVLVVHVTDGSPRDLTDARRNGFPDRETYAAARRAELLAALAVAGIPPERARALDRVDQEAFLDLAGIAGDIADLLAAFAPEVVVAHPYEGGHPDHDAAAFGVHAAVRLLAVRGSTPPEIVEMTSYHEGPHGFRTGTFLPGDDPRGAATREIALPEDVRAHKRRMLECFRTQRGILEVFPPGVERFRLAPRYDFTVPPHPGTLLYERHPWGTDGPGWRARAREALEELRRDR